MYPKSSEKIPGHSVVVLWKKCDCL